MSKNTINKTIILAEDVRAEVDGRFSIIGTIPYTLKITKEKSAKTATATIAAYSEFEGLKDIKSVLVRITNPNNEPLAEAHMPPPAQKTEEDRKGFVFAGKFQNLNFTTEGVHKFCVIIDDKEFSKEFSIEFFDI